MGGSILHLSGLTVPIDYYACCLADSRDDPGNVVSRDPGTIPLTAWQRIEDVPDTIWEGSLAEKLSKLRSHREYAVFISFLKLSRNPEHWVSRIEILDTEPTTIRPMELH